MKSPYDTTVTDDEQTATDDASVIDLDAREELDAREDREDDPEYDREPGDEMSDPHATLDSDLFDPLELAGYRQRWQQVQAGFVDDPRAAVHDADELVDEVLDNLASRLSSHKGRLAHEWNTEGTAETEAMRQSFRRYRGFFQRLLSA